METTEYNITISKEELAKFPTVTFPGSISVVETSEAVEEALALLRSAGLIGFDTETKPSFKKGHPNQVSLIQMSTVDHSYLFRLNKVGMTDSLRTFLEDSEVTKVGLSLKDDFFVLHKICDFLPGGFVDLQSEVKRFGINDSSLQKIYGIIFGERISKSQRLSNWDAPQLTEGQKNYASIDAWACLRIYMHLKAGKFHPEDYLVAAGLNLKQAADK